MSSWSRGAADVADTPADVAGGPTLDSTRAQSEPRAAAARSMGPCTASQALLAQHARMCEYGPSARRHAQGGWASLAAVPC